MLAEAGCENKAGSVVNYAMESPGRGQLAEPGKDASVNEDEFSEPGTALSGGMLFGRSVFTGALDAG